MVRKIDYSDDRVVLYEDTRKRRVVCGGHRKLRDLDSGRYARLPVSEVRGETFNGRVMQAHCALCGRVDYRAEVVS